MPRVASDVEDVRTTVRACVQAGPYTMTRQAQVYYTETLECKKMDDLTVITPPAGFPCANWPLYRDTVLDNARIAFASRTSETEEDARVAEANPTGGPHLYRNSPEAPAFEFIEDESKWLLTSDTVNPRYGTCADVHALLPQNTPRYTEYSTYQNTAKAYHEPPDAHAHLTLQDVYVLGTFNGSYETIDMFVDGFRLLRVDRMSKDVTFRKLVPLAAGQRARVSAHHLRALRVGFTYADRSRADKSLLRDWYNRFIKHNPLTTGGTFGYILLMRFVPLTVSPQRDALRTSAPFAGDVTAEGGQDTAAQVAAVATFGRRAQSFSVGASQESSLLYPDMGIATARQHALALVKQSASRDGNGNPLSRTHSDVPIRRRAGDAPATDTDEGAAESYIVRPATSPRRQSHHTLMHDSDSVSREASENSRRSGEPGQTDAPPGASRRGTLTRSPLGDPVDDDDDDDDDRSDRSDTSDNDASDFTLQGMRGIDAYGKSAGHRPSVAVADLAPAACRTPSKEAPHARRTTSIHDTN